MKVLAVLVAGIVALVGAAAVAYIVLDGPRMKEQEHIRAFEALMPLALAEAEPVAPPAFYRTEESMRTAVNPLEPTEENLRRGQAYYAYYCVFCHGETGVGPSPVGDSYAPSIKPLTSADVRKMTDGELLGASLFGPGHEVLQRIIPSDFWWPLTMYTRHLAEGKPPFPPLPPKSAESEK